MKSHKGTEKDLTPLYWAARNAKSESAYDYAMECMTADRYGTAGKEMAEYLLNVGENWQLCKAILWGNPMYGFQSSNIVEHSFSWMKGLKGYGGPYFFVKGTCIICVYKMCV
jgi:hypothetical protein